MPSSIFLLLHQIGCSADNYSRLYHTEPIAPSLNWESVEALDQMGPTIIDRGVNFSVYSENATRIDLLLFDDPEEELPNQQYEMTRSGDVWNLYVEGVGIGQHYGFVAWGPNWEYDPDFSLPLPSAASRPVSPPSHDYLHGRRTHRSALRFCA